MESLNFDLVIPKDAVKFTPAKVEFNDYERILKEAEQLNAMLHSAEINEDNLTLSKKLVAEVRKKVDALDRQRIDGKKLVLEDFNEFEEQIKLIKNTVQEGENIVRGKIREFDEMERQTKLVQVQELWDTHAPRYEFTDWLTFDQWFEERFLNKSQSINKTEESLIEWLENVRSEIQVIDNHPDREELMVLYKGNGHSLSKALLELSEHKKELETMRSQRRVEEAVPSKTEVFVSFKLTGTTTELKYKALESFLERQGIKYEGETIYE